MKEYLSCGIAKRIIIRNEKENESNDAILGRIGKNIDLNLYDRIDNEEYIILNIKKDILQKNAYELVNEQINKILMDEFNKVYTQYQLKELKNVKYDELIRISKFRGIDAFYFKRGDEISNDISYLDLERKCKIYCDLIQISQTGETFFECYSGMFTYFRNCIIKSSENPLKTALVITLTN